MYQHKYLQSSTGHLFLSSHIGWHLYLLHCGRNQQLPWYIFWNAAAGCVFISGGLMGGDMTYRNGPAEVSCREPAQPRRGASVVPLFTGPQPSIGGSSTRPGVVAVVGQAFCPTARAHPVAVRGAGAVILTVVVVDLVVVIVGGDRAAVARADGVRSEQGRGRFPRAVGFTVWFVQVTQRAG